MSLVESVPYAPGHYLSPTVWIDTELAPELPPVGVRAESPELELVKIIAKEGQLPATFPADMGSRWEKASYPLISLSSIHGRSRELPKEHAPHVLGDISIKGTTLSNPTLKTMLFYNELWGGMLYRDAVSAHNGSNLMHERGIDFGEKILAVARLKTMPTEEGIKPTNEAMQTYGDELLPLGRFRFDEPDMQPVAVIRSMPNAYRLRDLRDRPVATVYSVLDRSLRISAQQMPNLVGGLDPYYHADLQTYLTEHVPTIIGYAFGRLRAAGLRQKYPHTANMSLSLSLPDADGIVESELPPTAFTTGVNTCARMIIRTTERFNRNGKKLTNNDLHKAKRGLRERYGEGYHAGLKEKHPNEL